MARLFCNIFTVFHLLTLLFHGHEYIIIQPITRHGNTSHTTIQPCPRVHFFEPADRKSDRHCCGYIFFEPADTKATKHLRGYIFLDP